MFYSADRCINAVSNNQIVWLKREVLKRFSCTFRGNMKFRTAEWEKIKGIMQMPCLFYCSFRHNIRSINGFYPFSPQFFWNFTDRLTFLNQSLIHPPQPLVTGCKTLHEPDIADFYWQKWIRINLRIYKWFFICVIQAQSQKYIFILNPFSALHRLGFPARFFVPFR